MQDSLFDLQGKIALITGSGSGLGFAFAKGLGAAGADVVLNGRNEEKLAKAAAELESKGIKTHSYAFDVTVKTQVSENVALIESQIGPIDILVNNAGITRRGPIETLAEQDFKDTIGTNLTGAFLAAQQVAIRMIARKRGKIVNICSLLSEVGRPTNVAYAASKGGIKMLTKNLALELAKHNIQVNGIGPGYFVTELTQPLKDDPEFDAWLCARTPAARWGLPSELVGPLIFLCTQASSFVTGQVIYVDGGVLSTL